MDNYNISTNNNNNSGNNSIAVTAMVLGILSIVLCWVPLIGLVLAIVALVLAVKGLNLAKTQNTGRGFSIAGLSCGAAGCVLSIIYVFVWIFTAMVFKATYDELDNYNRNTRYNYNSNTYLNRTYNFDDDYEELTQNMDKAMRDIVSM